MPKPHTADRVEETAPGPLTLTAAGLFERYAPFAWRLLRRLGVPDADADDVCQEVFVTVHRRLPSFEGRSTPRTWLGGICVRVASDYRKHASVRRDVLPAGPVPDGVVEAHQEDELAEKQARALLDSMLGTLDPDARAVFVLYELEEMTMNDVAQTVGCPLQTAYSRLHAARRGVEAALRRLRAKEAIHG